MAVEKNAKVINMSIHGWNNPIVLKAAMKAAEKGMLVVMPTGNENLAFDIHAHLEVLRSKGRWYFEEKVELKYLESPESYPIFRVGSTALKPLMQPFDRHEIPETWPGGQ